MENLMLFSEGLVFSVQSVSLQQIIYIYAEDFSEQPRRRR